jgi:hypothetical protein
MNSAFIELKKHHNKINIVDIGAARAAFLFELSKVFELSFEDNNGTQMSDVVFINKREL